MGPCLVNRAPGWNSWKPAGYHTVIRWLLLWFRRFLFGVVLLKFQKIEFMSVGAWFVQIICCTNSNLYRFIRNIKSGCQFRWWSAASSCIWIEPTCCRNRQSCQYGAFMFNILGYSIIGFLSWIIIQANLTFVAVNKMNFRDVGLDLFRSIIMGDTWIEKLAIDGLLALIKAERLGEHVDRTLINSLVKMLCSLQVYE